MGDAANKDEAFKCVDIARGALRAGDTARAEKFAAKALRLYRCTETESMVLRVQVFISESGGASSNGNAQQQQHAQGGRPQQQPDHQQRHGGHQHHGHGASHHQQQQQQARAHQPPRGMGSSEGLRHRGGGGAREQQQPEDPSVTPEQRAVVERILAARSFYEVLSVERDASDTDIKQAYRKLALRLHPDKNKARKADEAFKLLSKAFSCLSTPDKRAYYDRTGYESTSAAQAAAAAERGAARRHRGGNATFFYAGDEFDPEEIFNAFFGAGAFSPHTRVFRSQAGGMGHRQGPRPPSREEQRSPMLALLQLLPVLLIVAVTLLSASSEPVYSLAPDSKYGAPLMTGRLGVKFYVKDGREFEGTYPMGSHKRLTMERQIETDAYERVYQRCQNERMAQHRAFTWGNRDAARRMELTNCAELGRLNERMGGFRGHAQRV